VPWPGPTPPPLERPALTPLRLVLELPARYGVTHTPTVAVGQPIRAGDCVATGPAVLTHAPLAGQVVEASPRRVVIEVRGDGDPAPPDGRGPEAPVARVDADYLRRIGLIGMGGSMFPAARKLAACRGVHTVVINGVECEPGITIDRALLAEQADLVAAGARALLEAVGAKGIVLALPRERRLLAELRDRYPFEVVTMARTYPAGAEKLIVGKLARRALAPGELPTHAGYLVHNTASLRALGLALTRGWPVIERPLSVARPDAAVFRNVIVPVGIPVGVLLGQLGVPFDRAVDMIVAGGLMMGAEALPDEPVTKGTTSLVVLRRQAGHWRERPCQHGAAGAVGPGAAGRSLQRPA
jgi:electron transport complex protein RnfC